MLYHTVIIPVTIIDMCSIIHVVSVAVTTLPTFLSF